MITRIDEITQITIDIVAGRAGVTVTTAVTDSVDGATAGNTRQISDNAAKALFNANATQNYLAAVVTLANSVKNVNAPTVILAPTNL